MCIYEIIFLPVRFANEKVYTAITISNDNAINYKPWTLSFASSSPDGSIVSSTVWTFRIFVGDEWALGQYINF